MCSPAFRNLLLHHAVPFPTIRAFPYPSYGLVPAALADVDCFDFAWIKHIISVHGPPSPDRRLPLFLLSAVHRPQLKPDLVGIYGGLLSVDRGPRSSISIFFVKLEALQVTFPRIHKPD